MLARIRSRISAFFYGPPPPPAPVFPPQVVVPNYPTPSFTDFQLPWPAYVFLRSFIWSTLYIALFVVLLHVLGPSFAIHMCRSPRCTSASDPACGVVQNEFSFDGDQHVVAVYMGQISGWAKGLLTEDCQDYYHAYCSDVFPLAYTSVNSFNETLGDGIPGGKKYEDYPLWPSPEPPRQVVITSAVAAAIITIAFYRSTKVSVMSRRLNVALSRVDSLLEYTELLELRKRRLWAELDRERGKLRPARIGDWNRMWPDRYDRRQ